MKTSQKILDFIDRHGPSTVAEISAALERTKADIREQIDHLCAQNRLERLSATSSECPGRPAARFAFVQRIPDALAKGLISVLVQYLERNNLDQTGETALDALIVNALVTDFHPCGNSAASCMNQAITYLEALGIKAKWHAAKSGPSIFLVHEQITSTLRQSGLSKKITRGLILKIKEKAVGVAPTA